MTYADDHAANPCNRCQSPPGVRCEHDEPTPAVAPGLDLDAVERAERAMTPGPWSMRRESHFVQIRAADLEELATTEQARGVDVANAAGIVALRNSAHALIAEVRALRAEVARRSATADKMLTAYARLDESSSAEIARLTKALDERECDMHARIRAGYDKTVADAWRAEVAKRDAEIARLTAELAAARAEVDCGQDGPCAKAPGCARHWQERNRELVAELAAARAVPGDVEAAIVDLKIAAADFGIAQDGVTGGRALATEHRGEASTRMRSAVDSLRAAIARAISDATAARGTVGGLLATAPVDLSGPAGSRWTNAIEWVDGETWFRIATGASADGSPTLVLSTWCDGGWGYEDENPMSIDACVYALPARLVPAAEADADPSQRGPLPTAAPRCSCTHEAGDSICDAHPSCSECGASTTRPVDGCEACRGPLPKGG